MPTPSAPLRLLFVEDDAAIVQGLQYALTQEGYAVTHAGSLAAARAALPAGFDLLLLDVRLPARGKTAQPRTAGRLFDCLRR